MAKSDCVLSKVEILPLQSMTLTREQFLLGERNAAPEWIAGELRLPMIRDKAPAVLLVHGSFGVRANVDAWANRFVGMGIAPFVIDCFNGRGLTGTGTELWKFSTVAMIVDVFESLCLLGRHPRIDPRRIAVMGVSRGASAALYASMRRFQRLHGPIGLAFAAHVALYPFCNMEYLEEDDVSDVPIRVFHGAADDWTPVETVRHYIGKLQRVGKDAELVEFADAYHSYDVVGDVKVPLPLQNAGKCRYLEQPRGAVINRETGEPDGPHDACMSVGATIGYHRAAHDATVTAVSDLFARIFELGRAPERRSEA